MLLSVTVKRLYVRDLGTYYEGSLSIGGDPSKIIMVGLTYEACAVWYGRKFGNSFLMILDGR